MHKPPPFAFVYCRSSHTFIWLALLSEAEKSIQAAGLSYKIITWSTRKWKGGVDLLGIYYHISNLVGMVAEKNPSDVPVAEVLQTDQRLE